MGGFLVSTDWLAERLADPDTVVVDGSWYMPKTGRDPDAEFRAAHIPGAVRFNIDEIADRTSDLPHTLASPDAFAAEAGRLGISEAMTIVVYDGAGLFSAPRVWWNFRVMGARKVHVLDGGFPKWQAEGKPVEAGPAKPRAAKTFHARLNWLAVASKASIMTAIEDGTQIVDARSPARFRGEEPEPRSGVQPGHIPGSRNIHYASIIEDGRLKDKAALRAAFDEAGVDFDKPVLTTCGSGVSAAILALAVEELGHQLPRLYDGSWTEWGGDPETPKETG